MSRNTRVFLMVPIRWQSFAVLGVPAVEIPCEAESYSAVWTRHRRFPIKSARHGTKMLSRARLIRIGLAPGGVCAAPAALSPPSSPTSAYPAAFSSWPFAPDLVAQSSTLSAAEGEHPWSSVVWVERGIAGFVVSAPELTSPIIWLLFAMAAKFAGSAEPTPARVAAPVSQKREVPSHSLMCIAYEYRNVTDALTPHRSNDWHFLLCAFAPKRSRRLTRDPKANSADQRRAYGRCCDCDLAASGFPQRFPASGNRFSNGELVASRGEKSS